MSMSMSMSMSMPMSTRSATLHHAAPHPHCTTRTTLHHKVVSSKTRSDQNVFWVLATPEAVVPTPCMQVGARPPDGFCYRVLPCIVKTGDALLQEQFALQLV